MSSRKKNTIFYDLILFAPIVVPFLAVYGWEYLVPFLPKFTSNDNESLWRLSTLLGVPYGVFAVQEIRDASKHYQEILFLCNNQKDVKSREKYLAKKRFKISRATHVVLGGSAFLVLVAIGIVSYDSRIVGEICVGFWSCAVTIVFVIAKQLENPLESILRVNIPEEWDKEEVKSA